MERETVYESRGEAQTAEIAARLAATLGPGDTVALEGGLGAGKTAFVRGLARGLGCKDDVSSPTFALVHEYEGGRLPLYHFDLYRLEDYEDLLSCGFFEYFDLGGVTALEWSEKFREYLPENRITVRIERGAGENARIVRIVREGPAC